MSSTEKSEIYYIVALLFLISLLFYELITISLEKSSRALLHVHLLGAHEGKGTDGVDFNVDLKFLAWSMNKDLKIVTHEKPREG